MMWFDKLWQNTVDFNCTLDIGTYFGVLLGDLAVEVNLDVEA